MRRRTSMTVALVVSLFGGACDTTHEPIGGVDAGGPSGEASQRTTSGMAGLDSGSLGASEGETATTTEGADVGSTSRTDAASPTEPGANCDFVVATNEISPQMPTVGVVEWSLGNGTSSRGKITYELVGAKPEQLNVGGETSVSEDAPTHRTLLLGLKQNSEYRFRIEAVTDEPFDTARTEDETGEPTCVSDWFALPTTGVLEGAPGDHAVAVEQTDARTGGFVLTTGGYGGTGAYILDADGAVVWYVVGPADPGRAHMDYEGKNMWIMSLNPVTAPLGQLQFVSMDGQTRNDRVDGFEYAHHDFVVMPEGRIATMVWRIETDPDQPAQPFGRSIESDLIVRAADGTITTAFGIGSNLYTSDEPFHANALHYIPKDDSFTISDRAPAVIVNVRSSGQVQWQLGGSCVDAPVGPAKCVAGSWLDTHGHHLLSDGSLLVFNNFASEDVEESRILEFDLSTAAESVDVIPVKEYVGTHKTAILGDVQRLPNGHTLITYSTAGKLVEVDAQWNVVQTFTSSGFGYAEWRPSLYGPPARL